MARKGGLFRFDTVFARLAAHTPSMNTVRDSVQRLSLFERDDELRHARFGGCKTLRSGVSGVPDAEPRFLHRKTGQITGAIRRGSVEKRGEERVSNGQLDRGEGITAARNNALQVLPFGLQRLRQTGVSRLREALCHHGQLANTLGPFLDLGF